MRDLHGWGSQTYAFITYLACVPFYLSFEPFAAFFIVKDYVYYLLWLLSYVWMLDDETYNYYGYHGIRISVFIVF